MSKEIMLMQPVAGLGDEGEVLRVADGYARNYLLPKKLAAPVTKATSRLVEKKRVERLAREAANIEASQELAARLAKMSVTITVKAGGGGKMYGSVTAAEILSALEEQGVKLDRRQLVLSSPIREVGETKVPVKLHTDVEATLKVLVVEE